MDLDRLTGKLSSELHMDVPGLDAVVRQAVLEAYDHGYSGVRLRDAIANGIEDGLGANGEHLCRHLSAEGVADWKGLVGRALNKALARTIGLGNGDPVL